MRSYRVIVPAASVLLAGCCAAAPGLASEATNVSDAFADNAVEQESESNDAESTPEPESEPDPDPEPLDLSGAENTGISSAAPIQIGQ